MDPNKQLVNRSPSGLMFTAYTPPPRTMEKMLPIAAFTPTPNRRWDPLSTATVTTVTPPRRLGRKRFVNFVASIVVLLAVGALIALATYKVWSRNEPQAVSVAATNARQAQMAPMAASPVPATILQTQTKIPMTKRGQSTASDSSEEPQMTPKYSRVVKVVGSLVSGVMDRNLHACRQGMCTPFTWCRQFTMFADPVTAEAIAGTEHTRCPHMYDVCCMPDARAVGAFQLHYDVRRKRLTEEERALLESGVELDSIRMLQRLNRLTLEKAENDRQRYFRLKELQRRQGPITNVNEVILGE